MSVHKKSQSIRSCRLDGYMYDVLFYYIDFFLGQMTERFNRKMEKTTFKTCIQCFRRRNPGNQAKFALDVVHFVTT